MFTTSSVDTETVEMFSTIDTETVEMFTTVDWRPLEMFLLFVTATFRACRLARESDGLATCTRSTPLGAMVRSMPRINGRGT